MPISRWLSVPLALSVVSAGLVAAAPEAAAKPWEPPAAQVFPFVDVSKPNPKPAGPKKVERAKTVKPVWPEAGQARVDGLRVGKAPLPAGETPVRVSVPDKAKRPAQAVEVEVLPRPVTEKLVGPGVVVKVTGEPGTTARVAIDYSGFSGGAGGGYGSRLRWTRLPDCAEASPDVAECQAGVAVDSENAVADQTVATTVSLPEAKAGVASASLMMAVV